MKRFLHLFLICFFTLIGLEQTNAEDVMYKTLDFAKASESKKVNSYRYDWTATDNGDTWLIHTFNNHESMWKYIRYKAKGVESYPYIINQQTFPKEVTKIEITIDYANLDIVRNLKIYVGTDPTMKGNIFSLNENVHRYDFMDAFKTALNNNKSGVVICNIPHLKKDSYYRIHFVIDGDITSNNYIQISKIVYYTSSVQSPDFSGGTAFLNNTTVTLNSIDEGAKIYYTTDGTEPTDKSTEYKAPFTLNATTTVKAVSYLNGKKSNVASQTFKKVEDNDLTSVAQALKATDNTQVYVKAEVTKTDTYDSSSPTLNYYIADNENAGETLEILNGRYLQNNKISNAFQIVRGDEVVVAATVNTDNGHKTLKNANLLSIKEYQDQAKVTTAGWATFVSRRAVDFSKNNDISAYLVKYNDSDNRVTLTPVTTIPGNTAVVVKANAGTYELQRSKENTTIVNNDLKFYNNSKKVTKAFSVYVLSKQGNGCGFYPVKVNDTIAPFKGFLTVNTTSTAAARPFYAIGNTTTGIINTMEENKNVEDVHYNLAGQRVDNNYKGLVIVNGHKVIRK